jgi:hypothetical protein
MRNKDDARLHASIARSARELLMVGYISAQHAVYFGGIGATRMLHEPFQHVGIDVNDTAECVTPILRRGFRNILKVDLIVRQFSNPGELIAFS